MMDRRKHHVEYASENMNKAFVKESDGDDDDELALPAIPPGSKNYMTPEGHKRIKDELLHLIDVDRPEVVRIVHWAASNGDRSENGDYIYGKRRLREIDSRVRYLTKRIDALEVVSELPEDRERVFFGAWVTVEDESGAQETYRIVGPDEFDLKTRKLSMDAPLARALLGKRVDDDIIFNSPSGERELYISAVSYTQPQS